MLLSFKPDSNVPPISPDSLRLDLSPLKRYETFCMSYPLPIVDINKGPWFDIVMLDDVSYF